jgi:hypothetical protein
MRCPATSSSSQDWSRGQALASASWASSTVSASAVTSRAQGDDLFPMAVADQAGDGDSAAHRVTVGRRGDQAEHDAAQHRSLLDGQAVVEPVRRARHRDADASGGPVAVDGEHVPVAASPRLHQRMGQEGEGARFPFGVANEQVDQPVFEAQPGLGGRLLDRGPECFPGQRTDQVQALFGEACEVGVDGQAGEMVGAHAHHHRGVFRRVAGEPAAELAGGLGVGDSEQLLELVDHHHRCPIDHGQRLGHRRVRIGSGHEHHRRSPLSSQSRDQPGPHQGRLAATRGAGHHQQRIRPQPVEARRHLGVPAEEHVGVGDVVGRQSLVRALAGHRGRRGGGGQ